MDENIHAIRVMAGAFEDYPADDYSRVENGAIAGRYLAKFWQPIALSRDHKPGRAKRVKMLGNYYTVYRTEDGEIKVVQDRCPHRGTSLAYGWVEGSSIRCRYHGWKFDGDGQGEDFPAETATYARSICLKTYPARDYLGVVFAYFGDEETPEFPRWPELEDESAGELLSVATVLPYNYYQRLENDIDEVHVHFTHGEFAGTFGIKDVPVITAKETDYGIINYATRPDGNILLSHCFMPNIGLREVVQQHDLTQLTIHLSWRVPIDDVTQLSVFIDRVGNPDPLMLEKLKDMVDPNVLVARIMAGEMTLDEVDENHPLLPVVQDTVCMAGQGIVADRKAENLGRSDRSIGLLRRIWTRELRALRDDQPLKAWKRSSDEKLPMVATVEAAA